MNLKNDLRILSFAILIFGACLSLPLFIALGSREDACIHGFALSMLVLMAAFALLRFFSRRRFGDEFDNRIRVKDGFFTVSATWLLFTLLGACPFVLCGVLTDYSAALFETASGFTTTGSTVFADAGILPKSILFYRSLTNFLGGMGVVVLFVALMPGLGNSGTKFTAQEMAGTNKDKILPRSQTSAKYLWIIYCALTAMLALMLILCGMSVFQAVCIAFSTMSTAGFALHADSIAHFANPYAEIIITIFMFIAAMNFSLLWLLARGDHKPLVRDLEARTYFLTVLASSLLIAVSLSFFGAFPSFAQSLRYAFFQYVSFITTTGFTSADISKWPLFAKIVLFSSYFLGGCQGSTAGGIKVIRICMLFAILKSTMRRKLHPKGVFVVKLGKDVVTSRMAFEIIGFVFAYLSISLLSSLVLSLDSEITGIGAICSSLLSIGNVGAGFSLPDFSRISVLSRLVLTAEMIAGRLEIFTVGALFTKSFWRR